MGREQRMMLLVPLNGMGSWLSSTLQIQKFLSLNGVENPKCVELYWSSGIKESSSSNENDQSATMKVIKVNNEWKTLLFIKKY